MFLVELDTSLAGFEKTRSRDLFRALGERLNALPGVEGASITGTVPYGDVELGKSVSRAGLDAPPETKPATAAEGRAYGAHFKAIGAEYFKTTGIPLLRGRAFNEAEATQPGGPAVAIIDEPLAKKLWPDGDALGQLIQFPKSRRDVAAGDNGREGTGTSDDSGGDIRPGEPVQVIGIVPAVRESLFEKEVGSSIYVPFARGYQSAVFFFVKFARLPPAAKPMPRN
jgi:hypothetical protein